MITYENQCVGCPKEMGCLGVGCPNRNVVIMECDACHDDCETLYEYNGLELCGSCLLAQYPKIEPRGWDE